MFKAFKEGQATPDATDSIIKLWTSQELYSIMHKNEEFNRKKAMEEKARIDYRLHKDKDNNFKYKCICDWSKDDKYGFIPNTKCPVHGKQTKKMLSKAMPIR